MSDAEKKRDAARRTYCAACVSALSARNDAIAAEHVAYDAVIAAAWVSALSARNDAIAAEHAAYDAVIAAAWVAYHAAPDAEVTP